MGTYNVKVKLNPAFGGTKLSGQIILASDGTWTKNVLSRLGCSEKGSWLATATVLSLSDLDPGNYCDPKKTGSDVDDRHRHEWDPRLSYGAWIPERSV